VSASDGDRSISSIANRVSGVTSDASLHVAQPREREIDLTSISRANQPSRLVTRRHRGRTKLISASIWVNSLAVGAKVRRGSNARSESTIEACNHRSCLQSEAIAAAHRNDRRSHQRSRARRLDSIGVSIRRTRARP
jgi:hypothetical protein